MNDFEHVEYEMDVNEVYSTDNFDFGRVLVPVRHCGYYRTGPVLKEKK